MNRATRLAIIALGATSCGSSGPSVEHARLGDLAYEVPSGWQSQELSDQHTKRVQWTPPDNTLAKESVVIMRSAQRAAQTKAGPAHVERLLEQAQQRLPKGTFSKPTRFTSKNGFIGVHIEGSFVPPGSSAPYHRVHAVLIDSHGLSFIHVLYTARIADSDAFEIVVDSLDRGA